jgi:hypothetical protein
MAASQLRPAFRAARDMPCGEALCQTQFGVKSLGLIGDSRCLYSKQKPPIYGGF